MHIRKNIMNVFAKKVENNIWQLAVHTITNKRVYTTFLSIYLLTMPGATERLIGLLTMIGEFAGFLLEIPSGYLSDKIGHKNALIFARVFMVLSTACYVFADSATWFVFGAVFLAFGVAAVSGTEIAFMHDTLKSLKSENKFSKIMGRVQSVGFAVPIIFVLILSSISDFNFKLAFSIALAVDVVGLVAVLLLTEPGGKEERVKEIGLGNFKHTLKEWWNVGWAKYIFIMSLIVGIMLGVTDGYRNTYQKLAGFSVSTIGVLWSISRLLISSTLLVNDYIYRKLSFRQFLIMRTIIYALSFIVIGFVNNKWLIAGLFFIPSINGLGLGSASAQYQLDFIGNSKSKTMLLSVNRLIQALFTGLFALYMSSLVTNYSYQTAYFVIGIVFVIVLMFSLLLIKEERNSK